jgi:hypothetical protein
VIRFACRIAAAVVFGAGLSCVSQAADPRYPDWPCVQAKVPDISVAAVWDGPPIEQTANTWQSEPEIKDLVARLAARRTSMEDAQRSIAQFLAGDPAVKADRGKRLFAGLFETLNSQRTEIMNGLERLARKEKELAEQIKVRCVRIARTAGQVRAGSIQDRRARRQSRMEHAHFR